MSRQTSLHWRVLLILALFFAAGATLFEACVFWVQLRPLRSIDWSLRQESSTEAYIVLGASILSPTTPSDALSDRLKTAASLYRSKPAKVIVTGDDGQYRSNEVAVMKQELLRQGVMSEDLLTDGHGYRTYESCKNAATVYGIRRAVIITQRFHLARALTLCRAFGIDAVGVIADRQPYIKISQFTIRELFASVKAVIDLYFLPPPPPVRL
ncbi:YdcF family protein [Patescibacteria group bacterium]|nr:YdcF family protein [Patescibacteria group bacterium]